MNQPVDLQTVDAFYIWIHAAADGPYTLDQFLDLWQKNALTKETLFGVSGGTYQPIDDVIPQLETLMAIRRRQIREVAAAEASKPPTAEGYYILRDGERKGPYDLDQMAILVEGQRIQPQDMIEHIPGDGQYHTVLHFAGIINAHIEARRSIAQTAGFITDKPLSGRFYAGLLLTAGLLLMGFFLLIFDISNGGVANIDALNIRLCGLIAGGVLSVLGAIFIAAASRKP